MNTTTDLAPGLYYDIPEAEYHALPGLSSTGIKRILDCPARYVHEAENRTEKAAYDIGHAVHAKVLGVGLDIEIIQTTAKDGARSDATDLRTKSAQEHRDQIRAAGKVPMLAAEYAEVEATARAVLSHPDATALLAGGHPEVSLLWDDPETGVRCRGRLDYLHAAPVVVDLKTTRTANPADFARTAASYGYDAQAAHYLTGLAATRGDTDARFIHVLVEPEPPHLVSVVELDQDFLTIGAARVRAAIDTYSRCLEANDWPGYEAGIHPVAPPRWHAAPETQEAYL